MKTHLKMLDEWVPVTLMLQDLLYSLEEWIYSRNSYEWLRTLGIFRSIYFNKEEVVRSGTPDIPIEYVYIPFPDHHPLMSYEELIVTDILNSGRSISGNAPRIWTD